MLVFGSTIDWLRGRNYTISKGSLNFDHSMQLLGGGISLMFGNAYFLWVHFNGEFEYHVFFTFVLCFANNCPSFLCLSFLMIWNVYHRISLEVRRSLKENQSSLKAFLLPRRELLALSKLSLPTTCWPSIRSYQNLLFTLTLDFGFSKLNQKIKITEIYL